MKRFIDLRYQATGYRFAWYDTIYGEFEKHGGSMVWDTFDEFKADYIGTELSRYETLAPTWALQPVPEDYLDWFDEE